MSFDLEDGSASKELEWQPWKCEPMQKRQSWRDIFIIPDLGWPCQVDPLCSLISHPNLLGESKVPERNPVSKTNVVCSWGITPKVDHRPLLTYACIAHAPAHECASVHTWIHIYMTFEFQRSKLKTLFLYLPVFSSSYISGFRIGMNKFSWDWQQPGINNS